MTDAGTLAYIDPNVPVSVVADASPYGLGAVLYLYQDGQDKVVDCGHRSLGALSRDTTAKIDS